MYNSDFKHLKFEVFRKNAGKVGFVMTPKRWIEGTEAIGITSKAGRYGGTYAHKDIAFEFCSAISAKFKLYLIQEFERLKAEQLKGLGEQWDVNRYLSKINYYIHTEAVQTERIPLLEQGTKKQGLYYAVEADMLNLIIFGTTAKQWKQINPNKKGNIRDHATTIELQVLANIEVLNAELLKLGMTEQEREEILNNAAQRHTAIIQHRTKKKLS